MMAYVLSEADRNFLASVPAGAPSDDPRRTGELYDLYGPSKGYVNGAFMAPVQMQGGGTNPDPCYVVGPQVGTNVNFTTAWVYLSGCTMKDTGSPGFPPPIEPPEEE